MNITFPYENGSAQGYLALPAQQTGAAVLVCHAWWGLNDFFKKGVCDRLAEAGFVAFAPDVYNGTIAKTISEAEAARDKLNWGLIQKQFTGAVQYLRTHPAVTGDKLGVLGVSLGAAFAFWLAEQYPQNVAATVIFYGMGEDTVSATQSAYLGHFAENDDGEDPAYIAQVKEKLEKHGRDVTFYTYPDTGHCFFESDVVAAYDPEAAALAWERTLAFLQERL
jgi:carboxymethylenebutenolidase